MVLRNQEGKKEQTTGQLIVKNSLREDQEDNHRKHMLPQASSTENGKSCWEMYEGWEGFHRNSFILKFTTVVSIGQLVYLQKSNR